VSAPLSPEYAPADGQKESVPLGYILQVPETFGYWDTDYGVQNEKGVSIGESTCTAKTVGWPADKPYGFNRAGIEDLSKIALERCETARCAVQMMGDIAVEQGFYSADSGDPAKPAYGGSSECLLVGDATPGDLWIFNIMTGKGNASAIWAAQRVPTDHVVAIGNAFSIRKMNLSDNEHFLFSPGVANLAKEMGWWSAAEESSPDTFDFFGSYGYLPTADKQLDPIMAQAMDNKLSYYSGRRMWRIFNLLSPSEGAKIDQRKGNLPNTDNPLPASVPAPRRTVTLSMIQAAYRDHYEGTPYDLTQGMAAGPYGNPNRGGMARPDIIGQWERAISMHRTSWSFVLEARPGGKSITWFGWDAPHGTAYIPFYGAATSGAPRSYSGHHHMAKFSTDTAWWAFNLVNQYQDLNFAVINKEVLAKAHKIEEEARQSVAAWEADADRLSSAASLELLTARSNAFADAKVAEWWDFAWSLIAKYRGYVITHNETDVGEDATGQAYPAWWLQSPEVGYTAWSSLGPFHGVLLAAQGNIGLLSRASLAEEGKVTTANVALILFPISMMLVGMVAHRVGLRQGRSECSLDSPYYIAQP